MALSTTEKIRIEKLAKEYFEIKQDYLGDLDADRKACEKLINDYAKIHNKKLFKIGILPTKISRIDRVIPVNDLEQPLRNLSVQVYEKIVFNKDPDFKKRRERCLAQIVLDNEYYIGIQTNPKYHKEDQESAITVFIDEVHRLESRPKSYPDIE